MKISIVIPTYNRRKSLEQCLASLVAQKFPATDYELIVVADGCTDDTVQFLQSFSCACSFRWITQSNMGAPAAQNRGVAAASGEFVLFMDDDGVCDPGLVAAHVQAHSQTENLVVIGAVFLHPGSPQGPSHGLKKIFSESQNRRRNSQGAGRSDMMLCANSSIARRAAVECPFDESYARIHDIEAGVRLWEKGYRPVFAPDAVMHEFFIKSEESFRRDSYFQGKFEVLLTSRHPEFKPLAEIAMMNKGNALKRTIRKRMALHPKMSDLVLRGLGAVAERLSFIKPFSWLAERLLSARLVIAFYEGAIAEAGSWKELEERFGKRVPVIMHHNVGTPQPDEYPGLTMPTAVFEAQISRLAKLGYKGIRPSDWLAWRDAGASLPDRAVMLVFDDAYRDACRNAFPILERYGFGAACMVVTGCIGSTNRWDEEAGRPSFQLMSESEIQEWSRKGIEFGGHTRHHPDLRLIPDCDVESEIRQCRDDLTELLGWPPACFAYPFGGFSPKARASACDCFQLGFTTELGIRTGQGPLHLGTNPHLVSRVKITPGAGRFETWCCLRLGVNLRETLRYRWSRLFKRVRSHEARESPLPT